MGEVVGSGYPTRGRLVVCGFLDLVVFLLRCSFYAYCTAFCALTAI